MDVVAAIADAPAAAPAATPTVAVFDPDDDVSPLVSPLLPTPIESPSIAGPPPGSSRSVEQVISDHAAVTSLPSSTATVQALEKPEAGAVEAPKKPPRIISPMSASRARVDSSQSISAVVSLSSAVPSSLNRSDVKRSSNTALHLSKFGTPGVPSKASPRRPAAAKAKLTELNLAAASGASPSPTMARRKSVMDPTKSSTAKQRQPLSPLSGGAGMPRRSSLSRVNPQPLTSARLRISGLSGPPSSSRPSSAMSSRSNAGLRTSPANSRASSIASTSRLMYQYPRVPTPTRGDLIHASGMHNGGGNSSRPGSSMSVRSASSTDGSHGPFSGMHISSRMSVRSDPEFGVYDEGDAPCIDGVFAEAQRRMHPVSVLKNSTRTWSETSSDKGTATTATLVSPGDSMMKGVRFADELGYFDETNETEALEPSGPHARPHVATHLPQPMHFEGEICAYDFGNTLMKSAYNPDGMYPSHQQAVGTRRCGETARPVSFHEQPKSCASGQRSSPRDQLFADLKQFSSRPLPGTIPEHYNASPRRRLPPTRGISPRPRSFHPDLLPSGATGSGRRPRPAPAPQDPLGSKDPTMQVREFSKRLSEMDSYYGTGKWG